MNTFHDQRTYTLNMKEYLPDHYFDITHTTIVTMLAENISSKKLLLFKYQPVTVLHLYASQIETLKTFCENKHLLLLDTLVKFEMDYLTRKRRSIKNIPIERSDREFKNFLSEYKTVVEKTYYPGIRHKNKYFTTGTQIFQCVKLKEHVPRHLYKFGKYLTIRYDTQPMNSTNIQEDNALNLQDTTLSQIEETAIPINHETQTLPRPQPNDTIREKLKLQPNKKQQQITELQNTPNAANNQQPTDKTQKLNNAHQPKHNLFTPKNINQHLHTDNITSTFKPQPKSITPPSSHPYYRQNVDWYKDNKRDSSLPVVSSHNLPIGEEVS